MSIPVPKSKRRRRPHNLLKVNNFSHSALQLNTPTNSRRYFLWSRNGRVYLQANRNLTPGTNQTRGPQGNKILLGCVKDNNTENTLH